MSDKKEKPESQLGKKERRFRFALNPHTDLRCTTCPGCKGKTKLRKLPLVIHVEPRNPVVLNKSCRYCPSCDLLIAHQDEIEPLLAALFAGQKEKITADDYLVMGTFDRDVWRRSCKEPLSPPEVVEHLHVFREVLSIGYDPGGWRRD